MAVILEMQGNDTGFRPLLSPDTPIEALLRDGESRRAVRRSAGRTLGEVIAPSRSRRIVLTGSAKPAMEWLKHLARLETDLSDDILGLNHRDVMSLPRELDRHLTEAGLHTVTDAVVASIDPHVEEVWGVSEDSLRELKRQVFLLVPYEVSSLSGPLLQPALPGSYVSCSNPILHLPLEVLGFTDHFNRFFSERRGVNTIGELAQQTDSDLRRERGCDKRWLSRIPIALNRLGLDLGVVVLGTSSESSSPDQHYAIPYFADMVRRDGFWPLIDMALGHFDGWRQGYLHGRYLELLSGSEMARRYGKDPLMAVTQTERVLAAALHPFRFIMSTLTSPVLQAMQEQGGVVHRDEIEELTGERDIRHFVLAANAGAGKEVTLQWRADLVTVRPDKEVLHRGALRKICHRGSYGFDSGSNWEPTNATDELVLILYESGKPMYAEQVLQEYRARGLSRWEYSNEFQGRDSTPNEPTRSATLAVQALLRNRPETYCLKPGLWVHESALAVPNATLTRAVDWSRQLLERTGEAYTPKQLHQEVDEAGLSHPELTPTLLSRVLSRRPDIKVMRTKRLVHVDADPLESAPLVEKLAAISIRQNRLLALNQFCALVNAPAKHSPDSVKNNLHKKPEFILCTPYGFIHEKALLWSTQVRSQAPAAALELLRDDGEPMPAMALLRELEQQFGPLHGSDHVATWALRGILDRAPEIFLGYGPLIARKISEGFRCLLTAAILSIVRSHGMASSAQIRSELVSRYHCFDNKHSYASCMNRLHDKLLRLPFYHYVHADNSDQEILAILSHSHHRFKHGRWVRSGDFYTNRAMLLLGLHYRRLGQDKVADEVRRQLLERNDVPADLLKRIREL